MHKLRYIEKFRTTHGGMYNYDKAELVDPRTPIVITCPYHGDFVMTPYRHTKHDGICPYCRKVRDENRELRTASYVHLVFFTDKGYRYAERMKVGIESHLSEQPYKKHKLACFSYKCSSHKEAENIVLGFEKRYGSRCVYAERLDINHYNLESLLQSFIKEIKGDDYNPNFNPVKMEKFKALSNDDHSDIKKDNSSPF